MEDDSQNDSTAHAPSDSNVPTKTNKFATASFVLGILSFLGLGPLASLPGLVFGLIADSRWMSPEQRRAGEKRTRRGLTLCYTNAIIVTILAILLPALARVNPNRGRAFCQHNLKQFGLVFKMFADENVGRFPQLAAEKGQLMFAIEPQLYPEYLADLTIFVCPNEPDAEGRLKTLERPESLRASEDFNPDPRLFINDHSYTYFGYVVTNHSELRSFAAAYKDHISKGLPFDTDLDVAPGAGSCGGDKILRLRENIERLLIKDISNPAITPIGQSSIPIMWDRCRFDPNTKPEKWFNHKTGANVLFMDGHVEFIQYPGKFPVTEEACRILSEMKLDQ